MVCFDFYQLIDQVEWYRRDGDPRANATPRRLLRNEEGIRVDQYMYIFYVFSKNGLKIIQMKIYIYYDPTIFKSEMQEFFSHFNITLWMKGGGFWTTTVLKKNIFKCVKKARSILDQSRPSFWTATTDQTRPFNAGVGNSFGFAGHIRDKLGIRGPVHVLLG